MIDDESVRAAIEEGRTALGIEFGSTRIKAVLIGEDNAPVATGGYDWDNQFVDRIWTYSLDDVTTGLQTAYAYANGREVAVGTDRSATGLPEGDPLTAEQLLAAAQAVLAAVG